VDRRCDEIVANFRQIANRWARPLACPVRMPDRHGADSPATAEMPTNFVT